MDKLKLKSNVTSRPTNLNLIMLFDKEKGVMYELNETASSIISVLLTEPKTASEISSVIAKDYKGEQTQIVQDIQEFINDFIESGIIEKV